jgi:small subunit ribosomal protein S7
MPRRKSVNIIRDVGVDPIYGQELIQKFINVVMWKGKKDTARRIVYEAFSIIKTKFKLDDDVLIEMFDKAVKNSTPLVEVRARRVGGSVFQVPVEVTLLRGRTIAFRNIINASAERTGKSFSIKLAAELIDAIDNKGGAVKFKQDKHKMADANRAFSHLVW